MRHYVVRCYETTFRPLVVGRWSFSKQSSLIHTYIVPRWRFLAHLTGISIIPEAKLASEQKNEQIVLYGMVTGWICLIWVGLFGVSHVLASDERGAGSSPWIVFGKMDCIW